MKAIQFLLVAALATMSIYACSSNASSDKSGKEYTAAYICPMHCTGSGSDQMDKCPVCKMDYVANKEHEIHATPQLQKGGHEGHNHDHGHEGHDHSGHNHDGHNH